MVLLKILLLGSEQVGKTVFIKRHATGTFVAAYQTTDIPTVTELRFRSVSANELVKFKIGESSTDSANITQEMLSVFDGVFIMFSAIDMDSYNNAIQYFTHIRQLNPHIPIVVCCNKVDIPRRVVKPTLIRGGYQFRQNNRGMYYEISARTMYHGDKPFEWLAQRLTNNNNITFTPEIALPTVADISRF